MKYVEEYRDPVSAQRYADAIHRTVTRPWTLMEICGGQTHSIVKYGIDELLPKDVTRRVRVLGTAAAASAVPMPSRAQVIGSSRKAA